MTNGITDGLRRLDSPLKKSYLNTFYCASELVQDGKKLTGKYCNNRWCLVCNRIRTAKLINGYKIPLEDLQEKQFVTLTIPNVPGEKLAGAIREMLRELRRIQNKVLRERKTPIFGIRKLEVTYNAIRGDFHPHFHLVVSKYQVALDLVSEWLKTWPTARSPAQDIRPADMAATMELFKYFTKLLAKGSKSGGPPGSRIVPPGALDTIFQAMRGLRVFQPMGIKKDIAEDIEDIQAEVFEALDPDQVKTWRWQTHDWIDQETGEVLADYSPSEGISQLIRGSPG